MSQAQWCLATGSEVPVLLWGQEEGATCPCPLMDYSAISLLLTIPGPSRSWSVRFQDFPLVCSELMGLLRQWPRSM